MLSGASVHLMPPRALHPKAALGWRRGGDLHLLVEHFSPGAGLSTKQTPTGSRGCSRSAHHFVSFPFTSHFAHSAYADSHTALLF